MQSPVNWQIPKTAKGERSIRGDAVMKKYLISFFCLFTMLFSLTACGQSEGVEGDDTDNAEASVSDEKKPEKDKNPVSKR